MAPSLQWPIVAALAAAAVGWDLTTRRVPNALTFGAAGVAFAVSAAQGGVEGLAWSVLGWLAGLGLFLPLFAVGGLGAGDVKLLAAFGACLGPRGVFFAAIWAALVGGVLAVLVAGAKGYLGRALGNVRFMVAMWRAVGPGAVPGLTLDDAPGPRLAYAVAIAGGAILALWRPL